MPQPQPYPVAVRVIYLRDKRLVMIRSAYFEKGRENSFGGSLCLPSTPLEWLQTFFSESAGKIELIGETRQSGRGLNVHVYRHTQSLEDILSIPGINQGKAEIVENLLDNIFSKSHLGMEAISRRNFEAARQDGKIDSDTFAILERFPQLMPPPESDNL